MRRETEQTGRMGRTRFWTRGRVLGALLVASAVVGGAAMAGPGVNASGPPSPTGAEEDWGHVTVMGPDGELLRDENGELITVDRRRMLEDGPPPAPWKGDPSDATEDAPFRAVGIEVQPVPASEAEDFLKYRN